MSFHQQSTSQPKHAIFMNMSSTGHINPTLPVVARLRAEGCSVSYFVDQSMQTIVEAAGAAWRPFRPPGLDMKASLRKLDESGVEKYVPEGTTADEYNGMPMTGVLYHAEQILPSLLEDVKALEPPPSVIIYDTFMPFAQVVAHVIGIPAVSTLTMPGPGVLTFPDAAKQAWDSKPWVVGPAQTILDTYGFDVLKAGGLFEFYSTQLNLVTTINDLYVPPRPGRQAKTFGDSPFKCVGVLKDTSVARVNNANATPDSGDGLHDPLPFASLAEARRAARHVLYVSMGTMTTGYFWDNPFNATAASNGLQGRLGKELVQCVFRSCFEAVGENEDFLVVLSLGRGSDALDGLPPVPSNFIVRSAVPQLEVLEHCSAFVTHGGANSMHEALSYGVPMIVVPAFGDQPLNAESIANVGAGLAFPQPLSSVSTESMRSALLQLTAKENNSFCVMAQQIAKKFTDAGGVEAATKAILEISDSKVSLLSSTRGDDWCTHLQASRVEF